MAAVASSLPPVSWQERFRMEIAQDVNAAIPSGSDKTQRAWILENCEKPAESISHRSIASLSVHQRGALFVSAVCKTIKKVAQERLDILIALIEIERTPGLFQALIGRRTVEDRDFFKNVNSWIEKRKLLEQWIQDPFLVIPKSHFIRSRFSHLTS